MLRQVFCVGMLTLAISSAASVCWAIPLESVPNSRQVNGSWVTDMADLLSADTEIELSRRISTLEIQNTSEIAIVTVPDIAPSESPRAFAIALFNRWGIGKRGQDNGVLLLVSKRDRRVEIITGKGLTALLPEAQVSDILQQEITPKFKQQQFDAGILAGTEALIAEVSQYRISGSSTLDISSTLNAIPRVEGSPAISLNADRASLWAGLVAIECGIGGVVTIAVILLRRHRVKLSPTGESRVAASVLSQEKRVCCAICDRRMVSLNDGELSQLLSAPQQAAQRLGSVVFKGWRCLHCYPQTAANVHLRTYILRTSCDTCPDCQMPAVREKSVILQSATKEREGIRKRIRECHCCSFVESCLEPISALVQTSSSDSSDSISFNDFSNSSSSSGSSDSSSSSDSWSSSGSSDFGGGSSSGDGAGSSW